MWDIFKRDKKFVYYFLNFFIAQFQFLGKNYVLIQTEFAFCLSNSTFFSSSIFQSKNILLCFNESEYQYVKLLILRYRFEGVRNYGSQFYGLDLEISKVWIRNFKKFKLSNCWWYSMAKTDMLQETSVRIWLKFTTSIYWIIFSSF